MRDERTTVRKCSAARRRRARAAARVRELHEFRPRALPALSRARGRRRAPIWHAGWELSVICRRAGVDSIERISRCRAVHPTRTPRADVRVSAWWTRRRRPSCLVHASEIADPLAGEPRVISNPRKPSSAAQRYHALVVNETCRSAV